MRLRVSLSWLQSLALIILVVGSLPLFVFHAIRYFDAPVPPSRDLPVDLQPLERFFLSPNASYDVVTTHPFERLLDPGSAICSGAESDGEEERGVFLLVYVHSAPQYGDRRAIIRRTWGNVTKYEVTVRVVFITGVDSNASSKDSIRAEYEQFHDIVQENFTDTYDNITYKAVAALRWVIDRCPQAAFVLKADDDAFVSVANLLRLLLRMSAAHPSLHVRKMMCNLWVDRVPRVGKWGLQKSVFRFDYYPPFCQGLAFVMSRDLVAPLYNATFYTPFLRMDDVYLTGFAIMRVEGATKVEMNSYYVKYPQLMKMIRNDDWIEFVFSHVENPEEIPKLWTLIQRNAWSEGFQSILSRFGFP